MQALDDLKKSASEFWDYILNWPKTHPVVAVMALALILVLLFAIFKK